MNTQWRDKQVLVLGLGESGLAMAAWLSRCGARLRVADSRPAVPRSAELARVAPGADCVLGPFDASLLDGVNAVAISPGLDPRMPLVDRARSLGLAITGEMELLALALRELGVRQQTRIIAITGTNGKTTTTALAGDMARAAGLRTAVAGNISPAALAVLIDHLDRDEPLPEAWVLELSSFQLETMYSLDPDAATVLNVSDDHLDRYADIAAYAATKARIFQGEGVMVLNREDSRVAAMAIPGRRQRWFGTDAPRSAEEYGLELDADGEWLGLPAFGRIARSELALAGAHNAANALAALALCRAIELPWAPLLEALRAFRGLAHRVQQVARRDDGVIFYDDSKGTNVGATVAALEGLRQKVVLIAGGDGKGQDFSPLAEPFVKYARAVVLLGRDAPLIAQAVADCGVALEHVADMDEAVARANALAQRGDAVLLSPACSSLDMYRNYAHRAEVFVNAVRRLPQVVAA
ncbi:MAG: UDP-N-acetylmuramoyl-L-alanine--D-glutamate ligase [Rhodocyclaceae bacterium]|nr:UDP-N-acetylmuramoyl-L-alanine--D-glutamate ligase [Rhodocyclaceae bacterium]MCP5255725.1 UDP-N-acetylmuramoyl-L-alanine--D-glutamate ligase [Zoogloeaceae bacterium]